MIIAVNFSRAIVSLMKNEQRSQNVWLKVDPRSSNFLQPITRCNKFFLLNDKLITQGDKRETSTKACNKT